MTWNKADNVPTERAKPGDVLPVRRLPAASGCERCSGAGYLAQEVEGRTTAVAVRCECAGVCAQCGGEGFVRVASARYRRGVMTDCVCRTPEMCARLYTAAGVPARYAHARVHGDRARRVHGLLTERRSLTVCGSLGRGKTHSLAAIAYEATMVLGKSCRYVDIVQLAQDRREAMRPGAEPEEAIAALCKVAVLLVDELGRSRATDWEQAIVEEVVSRRYESRLPIYAATNLEKTELRAVIGDRAWSRLHEMGRIVPMEGDDQRSKRAGQG